MPLHHGYPVGRCERCGVALPYMGLCGQCAAEFNKPKLPNFLRGQDECDCPRYGGVQRHTSLCLLSRKRY